MDPAVLIVDDEPASVAVLRITLGEHFPVHTATDGHQALAILEQHRQIAVAIIDQRMPGMSGAELIGRTAVPYPDLVRIILTGYTDLDALIQAINAGRVFRYLTKPWSVDELVATVRQGLELHRLSAENLRLQRELSAANLRLRRENAHLRRSALERAQLAELVGTSAAMTRIKEVIARAAASESTVLVLGETGTGKELAARAVHYNSPRADQPFVSENCGAIAADLLTSELFGHRRGAFTGALEDRQGLFELADGGTLFLDEIGDCPPELQVRLLRVLDQGEIRRVGDNQPRKVDVRIVAATHHDLERDVEAGRFRRDLFYRLRVVTIRLPPLRERVEDVPLLAQHFLDQLSRQHGKCVRGFTPEALGLLLAARYDGNVRELHNLVERAFAFADDGGTITADLLSESSPIIADLENGSTLRNTLEQVEQQLIRDALERHDGNQTHTAAALGISRQGLIDKLQRYGLRKT